MPKLSITEYYKAFGPVKGALTALGVIAPVCASQLQHHSTAYIFPPIGDSLVLASIVASGLALVSTTYGYFAVIARRKPRAGILFAGAAICLLSYVCLAMNFVVRVDDPVSDTADYVTVGYERSAFAKSNFPSSDDVDMLMHRGTPQREIDKLWTIRSLTVIRMSLIVCATGGFCLLVALWSAFVAESLP
jgi:hypothetical protein